MPQSPSKSFLKKTYTPLDSMYELIKEKRKLKLYEISKKFKLSKEKSLEWCKILENEGIIKINYSAFSEPDVEIVS